MTLERAEGLVVRATDWSETSRIVTTWTREFGRVRLLAKGGRRLKSNFESALDLLSVYSIVLVRKTSGSLDLLTEISAGRARVFSGLAARFAGLYAAYYVAELLSDWTEDYDPHPAMYDETLAALADFGGATHKHAAGRTIRECSPQRAGLQSQPGGLRGLRNCPGRACLGL